MLFRIQCLALIIAASSAQAQVLIEEPSAHRIGLQSGFLYTQSRDELASPLKYSSAALPFALSYEYVGESHRHTAGIAFHSSTLESAVSKRGDHSVLEVAGELTYAFLTHALSSDDERLQVYAGGLWQNSFAYRDYTYIAASKGDETFGNLYSSLSVTGHGEYLLSPRSRLSASLSLPVLTFVVRPGYSSPSPAPEVEDDFQAILTGGTFASWESYRAFDLRLGYGYSLSSVFDLDIQYRLSASYYDKPQPIAAAVQTVYVGLLFKL